MAKLAVLFFAALAFQAAFAGVRRHHRHQDILGDYTYGGQYEDLVGQIQGVTRDVSVTLEDVLPNNRQVYKTLTWQFREFAQTIDDIISRLRLEGVEYDREGFDQVISELQEIQVLLQQTGEYTDVSTVSQLKNQLNTHVQNAAEQIEKLIRLVPSEQTQGSLQVTLRGVLNDFLASVQKIQTQLQFVGIQGKQTPKELTVQIQDVTGGLVNYLQGSYVNYQQIKLALREYVQNIEAIISRLQKEQGIVGNVEIDNVIQQIVDRLRQILVPVMQITDAGMVENFDILKVQLVKEFEVVAEELQQLVQYGQIGSQQTLVQDVLFDYLRAIQQVKMQIQGNNLYGGSKYDLVQGDIYGKDMIMTKPYKYGKSGKGLAIQIQVVVSDLAQTLQTVYLDNTLLRQTLIGQFREYIQVLETIVVRLEQVKYDTTIDVQTVQPVVQNLREIIMTLRQILGDVKVTLPVTELRRQLCLYIQNFGNELQKLALGEKYGIQQVKGVTTTLVKDVLVQYLIATRNLQVQLQSIAYLPQRDQIATGFGIEIQTLADGLTTGLESVSVDNLQVKQVLTVQCRELAQQIEYIIERLQGQTIYESGYGVELPQQVVENLRQIVVSLRRLAGLEGLENVEQLRMQLIAYIQEASAEIQKLLWVGQDYFQGQKVNGVLYEILRDFVATLQNQQIQLQNVYQAKQYGQNTQQLAVQIQVLTNNLAIFLQNVPANGQIVDVQVRKLVQIIESIIDRLEVEVTYTKEITGVQQIVLNLRRIVASLERVTELETSNYGLAFQLNLVLQNVSVELKKLAWIAQSDLEIQGNLNALVRSVLVQYLTVLQRVQIELQGINQTVQIGQTPRELALQIQIVANRLSGILRTVVPDNRQTQGSLIWQVRRFYQILDTIVARLQVQITKGYGKTDLLQQVFYNLNQIKLSLEQVLATGQVFNGQQLKMQLAIYVQDAAVEIQKLMWVAQYNLQGNADVFIKGVLIDFLTGLQSFQLQIQNNLQIVYGGQNPRSLAIQIESVANRLFAYLQWAQLQPNTQQFRQTLIIQIGEFTQTIENLVQMLRTEIKNYGENTAALQQIIAQLTKISFSLQKLTGVEANVTVEELSSQLVMHVQDVVVEIQRLAWIAQNKLELTEVNYNGALNGVLNNFLASLRNMFIQLQNTQEFGQYGLNIKELANQIQIVSNKLTASLQNVVTGTKQVKQILAIQIFKYARRIQTIVDRLETEVSYDSEFHVDTLRQVALNLRQIVVGLQQIGESLMTKTTIELKNLLNNYVQNVNAEIQKLMLIQSNVQQYKGEIDTVVKSVLIEYLAAVQNLQIKIQYVTLASQKGLTLPQLAIHIETIVKELTVYLQRIAPTNKLAKQTVVVEARQLAEIIANIVNKLQSETVSVVGNNELFQRIAMQLKEVQLVFQRIAGIETVDDIYQQKMQLLVNVQRVSEIIMQLVWAVQPEYQLTEVTGKVSLVREILNDFLTAVQNVDLQIQIALQNGQADQYYLGLQGLQGYERLPIYQGSERLPIQSMQGLQYGYGYGYSKVAQPMLGLYGRQYYGGKYYGGSQMTQTPQQFIAQIEMVVRDLSMIFQDTTFNGQQVAQVLSVQARQFAEIIKNVIVQLEEQVTYKVVDTTFQQVIERLREVQLSLQRLAAYNTFTSVRQIKIEFDSYIQTVVAQIRKLMLIAQEETDGKWYLTIKTVLNTLFNGVRTIYYQLRDVTQYDYTSQYGKYDQGYGYGKYDQYNKLYQGYGYDKYDQGYGYDKYNQLYGKYDQGYGYGKYAQGYDKYFQGQYDQLYGKYDQLYGKYDQLYGKYDQGYGYGKYADQYKYGQYGLQGMKQSKYGNDYGLFYDQYGYGLQGKYGYGLEGKYGYEIKGQSVDVLISQIRMVAGKIVDQLQTVGTTDKQIRQMLVVEARQLVQIIDNMIDRLQICVNKYEIVREVIDNLRQIQVELRRIATSGVITTVYQIRGQIVNYIENIVVELQKLVTVVKSDVEMTQIVKDVLVQYFIYLRNIYYQYQYGTMDKYDQVYGKYDQMYGKYDQMYGKYDQLYGKYDKFYGKYDQLYGKYDQTYGKYDQLYGKYDQSYGKYDQLYGKYDQSYGKYDQLYGKYDQTYGKYDQLYGKYDQTYGKYDQLYGKYDQTYGKYDQAYGKYDQLYGKYDQVYGKYNQGYGFGKYQLQGDSQAYLGNLAKDVRGDYFSTVQKYQKSIRGY